MRIVYVLIGILILVFGYLYVQETSHPQLKYNSLADRLSHPFDTRLRFKVEQVDPGFGLTRDEVIVLTQEAIDIWHKGANRNDLMVYDENAKLGIKLIYDHRQQEYDAQKKVTQKILNDQAQYKRQAENLTASRDHLDQQQQRLIQDRNMLAAEYQMLAQRRSQSGLSSDERQQIAADYARLQEKSDRLKREVEYQMQQSTSFNDQIYEYQSNVKNHQRDIRQAEQRFPPREFHKGLFMEDEIHVYQFDAKDDLRLTLAHELGHALGLYHHSDPEALMYPMLGKQKLENFELRPADKTLLFTR